MHNWYNTIVPRRVSRKVRLSQLRTLARLNCSEREAAGALKVSLRIFKQLLVTDKRAARVWEQGQQEGKLSLRRKQFRLAEKSAGMAIFLGKNLLGQRDKTEQEVTTTAITELDFSKLDRKERDDLRQLLATASRKPS